MQEVGHIRIVAHYVEHARAVDIEIAAGEIDARKHRILIHVARRVDIQQFERDFQAVEVGLFQELGKFLIGVEGGVGEHGECELAEIQPRGEPERYAVLECGIRVEFQHYVFKILRDEGAKIVAALAVRLEGRHTGQAQSHHLGAELCSLLLVDEVDDVHHHVCHVDVGAFLRRGEHVGIGGRDVDLYARACRDFEFEARIGLCRDDEFQPVAAAHVEAYLAVLVKDEVLEAEALLGTRDERDEVAEQVGREQDVQPQPVFEQVEGAARKRGVHVAADDYLTHERVEEPVDVEALRRALRAALRAVRRRDGFAGTLGGLFLLKEGRHFHLFQDAEQIRADLGSAQPREIEVDITVGEIHADGGGVVLVLGIEDYLQTDLQRVEYLKDVESGQREIGEYAREPERLEIQRAEDAYRKVVADGIVDVKLRAEGRHQHIHYGAQGRVHLSAAYRVGNGVQTEHGVDDIAEVNAPADILALVVLHESAVGQFGEPVRKRISVKLILVGESVCRVCGVTDGEVQPEARDAAPLIALEGVVARHRRDGVVDVDVDGIADVGLFYRYGYVRIFGEDLHADGGSVKVHRNGDFRTEIQRVEDAVDVRIRARHRAYDAEEHRFGDIEREMPFAYFEDDVQRSLFGLDGLGPVRRRDRFGGRRSVRRRGKRAVDRVEHGGHESGVFDLEPVALRDHAEVDIEHVSSDICAEDESAVGAAAVAQFEHDFRLLGIVEVDVRAQADVHREGEVVPYRHAEVEHDGAGQRGEYVADGQFAVFKFLRIEQSELERQRGVEGHGDVIVVDALVFGEFRLVDDARARVVDRDAEVAESYAYRHGIGRYREFDADVAPLFAHTVEHRDEAPFGIQLQEVLLIQLVAGKEEVEQSHEQIRPEVHSRLVVGHVNAVDEPEYRAEDVRFLLGSFGGRVALRRGDRAALFASFGRGGSLRARDERAEVYAGHRDLAAYYAAIGGAYVQSAPAVLTRDDVEREQIFALRHVGGGDLQRDVGIGEDIFHQILVVQTLGEAQERAEVEVYLLRHGLVDDEGEHQPLDEALQIRGDTLDAAGEVAYPFAYAPLRLAVRIRGEFEGTAELGVHAVKVEPVRAELVVFVEQRTYARISLRRDVGGDDARRLVEGDLAQPDAEGSQRHSHVRESADAHGHIEEIAVFVRVARDIAPIQAERGVYLAEVDADEVGYHLSETLRHFDDEALGGDRHQEFERAHAVIAVRRGDGVPFRAGRGEQTFEQSHYVEFRAHACAYKRARVNIEYTVCVICAEQDFVRVVRLVEEAQSEFRLVVAADRRSREGGEQAPEVEFRVKFEREIEVHSRREADGAEVAAQRHIVGVQIDVKPEREVEVDVRFVEEVHKDETVVHRDGTLAVDDGVDPAQGHAEVKVVAQTESEPYGQPLRGGTARYLQAVVEVDAHTGFQPEGLVRTCGVYLEPSHSDEVEEGAEQTGTERHVEIEVAKSHVRRGDDGKQLGRYDRGGTRRIIRRAVGRTVRRAVRGGVIRRYRLARSRRVGEEGVEVHLQGKPAQQLFGGGDVRHALHQPYAERRGARAALLRELNINVEVGYERHEVECLSALGESGYEIVDIGELGVESESRRSAEGFAERREHRDHEVVRLLEFDVRKVAALDVDVEVGLETYLYGLHAREHLADVQIHKVVEGRELDILAALVFAHESGDPVIVIGLVRHRAEARGDGHAEGGELLFEFVHARGEPEVELDLLVACETVIFVGQAHVLEGDTRAFHVSREHESEYGLQDALGESDLYLFDVEDVAVHLNVYAVEYGLHHADDVHLRLALIVRAYRAHDLALVHRFLRGGNEGGYPLLFLDGQTGVVESRLHRADEILESVAEDAVDVHAVNIEFARAEEPGQIDVDGFLLAHVAYARAHVLRAVRAREFDEKVGLRIVEHIDVADDVQFEGAIEPRNVDLFVKDIGNVVGDGTLGEKPRDEGAECAQELIGRDIPLVEFEVERKGEVHRDEGIFRQAVEGGLPRLLVDDAEPSAALFLGGEQIALDVQERTIVVPLYAVSADGDLDVVLLYADLIREIGAVGVEVEPDVEPCRRKLSHAVAVIGSELGDKIQRHIRKSLQIGKINARKVVHEPEDVVQRHAAERISDDVVERAAEYAAQRAADDVRKRYGHLKTLRAVLVGDESGRAEEVGKYARDGTEHPFVGGKNVVEKELSKTVVVEKSAQSIDDRRHIHPVRLDHGRAGFQPGAVVDDGGIEIIYAEEHVAEGDLAVHVARFAQFETELRVGVVFKIDVRLDLERVCICHGVLDVLERHDVIVEHIRLHVGIGGFGGVHERVPRFKPRQSLIALVIGIFAVRSDGDGRSDIRPAVRTGAAAGARRGFVARHEKRRRKAEYENNQKRELQFSHNFPPMLLRT